MSSPKEILRKYRAFPIRRLGQNFLIDKGILKKIIEVAELSEKDIVLEIGPGIGNLTIEIAKKAKKVIAIEKDKRMVEILGERLKEERIENVEIVNEDVLKFLPSFKPKKDYKVVANIPYYLTLKAYQKPFRGKEKTKINRFNGPKRGSPKNLCKTPKNEPFSSFCTILRKA